MPSSFSEASERASTAFDNLLQKGGARRKVGPTAAGATPGGGAAPTPSLEESADEVKAKAAKVYNAIDDSGGFYYNGVDKAYRSQMNAPFRIGTAADGTPGDRALERAFVEEAAAEAGCHYLFGHPVKGGVRVTMYVGQTEAAIDAVVAFMKAFAAKHKGAPPLVCPLGVVAGLLFVGAISLSFVACVHVGLSTGQGVWGGSAILVAFLCIGARFAMIAASADAELVCVSASPVPSTDFMS